MTLSGTTITLSLAELCLYHNGSWDSFRLEEDVIDLILEKRITAPVAVRDTAGRVLFAVTGGERHV
jgi:hypothetical protein